MNTSSPAQMFSIDTRDIKQKARALRGNGGDWSNQLDE
jgi:hypothetical protein